MKKYVLFAGSIITMLMPAGCKDDYDEYDNSYILDNDEAMTLAVSSPDIVLDEGKLAENAVTFTWTPARQMPDEYVVNYVTMLDLKANNFSSKSVVRNVEDEGVFSRSFTHEALQNYITKNWGKSADDEAVVSFKVIASWEGGAEYAMPEVRTVDVTVHPFRPAVFDADIVYLSGSAKTGISREEVSRTLEDEYVYAALTDLKEGELTIPVEYEGVTQYIVPSDNGEFRDGVSAAARMVVAGEDGAVPDGAGWIIPSEGEYRVVIDMLDKIVTIYSPDNEFNKPFVIKDWHPRDNPDFGTLTTEVTELWLRGGSVGWSSAGRQLNMKQSLADPQVLVYDGEAINGSADFAIKGPDPSIKINAGTFNVEHSCIISPPADAPDAKKATIVMDTWMDFEYGTRHYDYYWLVDRGINFIVFDFRNQKVKFSVK